MRFRFPHKQRLPEFFAHRMSTTTLPPYVFPNPEIPQALLNHPNLFTIQEHAATRHHWDLRLRVRARNASDGDTLRSWAVPKGPSYVVGSRTLAMETEDHDVGVYCCWFLSLWRVSVNGVLS